MNILFVETNLPAFMGGVERVTSLLANGFETYGNKCFFAYHKNDDSTIPQESKFKFNQSWSRDEFCHFFSDFTKEKKINLIINQDLYLDGLIFFYKNFRECGGKVINCYHMSPGWKLFLKKKYCFKYKLKDFFLKIIYGCGVDEINCHKMYKVVDKFVLLSDSFIDDFTITYAIKDKSKLCGIPNPLTFPKIATPDIINNKENEALMVTRFVDVHKNISAALRIWKKVEDYGIKNWVLRIVGYGEDEIYLKEYAHKLGLENVVFEGKSDNPLEYYQRSKIFIMTSNFEGFGMTLTEAMQNACLPIAFDTYASLHDIIEDGYNGIIINRHDEDSFANNIFHLMSNESNLQEMQRNALKSSRKFSHDVIMEKWLTLINEKM